jgi:hypothetical protein
LLAAFSRHLGALQWARHQAQQAWGRVHIESTLRDFSDTSYYEASMGPNLKKVLWGFGELGDSERLVDLKRQTNEWEVEYAADNDSPEPRPLNLDPGYLTEAKLVLATTKDRDHRIYLGKGIFAEVTLTYRQGAWSKNPWTYPDYQSDEYHQFFSRCREFLREQNRR